ncbi:hypothetical protein AYO21_04232 [Fonsecaea monophora]|uniref:Vacuolar membrane-associated protein IML1 n=1 Tax=Fonsecaea monophora TaxID=254056 RepID=A0A177FD34_9EURO|nr:hypothetical protein AYO21_04232 [Fonsecaea monophora]OAG41530.1 hypothetical protein AYO21_04232 [Fonsecaea monophora]
MLGRLIQGYARGGQLESATEETHTRSLLWPESHAEGRVSSLSPPSTPYGSPTTRVSPFDDRIGLELNESKDLRLIVAQDAFGTNDRPLLLYDTHFVESKEPNLGQRAPVPSPAAAGAPQRVGSGIPILGHARNRSSTISGASASWARPHKESEPTDHLGNVLDCMFGVSSAAKSGSSTKLHFLPGDRSPASDLSSRAPTSNLSGTAPSRAPLLRARTATTTANNQSQNNPSRESDPEPRDAVLITRMFSVTLPEAQDDLRQRRRSSADPTTSISPLSHGPENQMGCSLHSKKPKLVEKKTPVFAIGLLFYLPRPGDVRSNTSSARPSSRASFTPSSTPNSYGSDSFSSWTILNAIPEYLWSSDNSSQLTDRGIDIIVGNWEVILRSLAVVETLARSEIGELLQEVNLALITSAAKAPKGPSEQRTNQRNVYLRSPNRLAQVAELQRAARHTLWRVSYALRIPRVYTGLGLDNGGHWLDEARYLVRLCGNKQQNFFLFNLLTAFLGNHTEWLERLGPDWYRRQLRVLNKGRPRPTNVASRTVIVCENRSMARRIIFLLASFLPRNAITKLPSEVMSPLLTPDISSSSPIHRIIHEDSLRRHAHNKSRDGTVTFYRRDGAGLSSSVSSSESASGIARAFRRSSRSRISNAELTLGMRQVSVFSPGDNGGSFHKTNPTSSTATPGLGTPVPHFATKAVDSYFPEGAVVDSEETGASADLARILRRDSVSQSQSHQSSMNWGSLISNVSGLWNKRQDSTASTSEITSSFDTGSLSDRRRFAPKSVQIHGRQPSRLEAMVDEAGRLRKSKLGQEEDSTSLYRPSTLPSEAHPPRLTVDERDGVVDVDINIPGFIGWNEGKGASPPSWIHHRSPSFASVDEAGSMYSTHSRHADVTGCKSPNVAGYLKRFHEDFILQGVKPYTELQDEIRRSMSREPTPSDDMSRLPADTENNGEQWVTVCTTLLADLRNFSIQRLTLRRLTQRGTAGDTGTGAPSQSGSDNVPHGSGASSSAELGSPATQLEQFDSEIVMDFDTTLTDAIERVLNETEPGRQKSGAPTRTHSRTVSTATTSSVRSLPLEISGSGKARDWRRPTTLSQSDCRQVVVGALEEVVKSVNDDLTRHNRSRDADGHIKMNDDALNQEMKQDNVLLHRRTSSGSTVRATGTSQTGLASGYQNSLNTVSVRASLWIHDDAFSSEDVLINEAILAGSDIHEGGLIKIFPVTEGSDVRDFQSPNNERVDSRRNTGSLNETSDISGRDDYYLCITKFASAEFKAKQANLQVSIKSNIATAFGFRPRSYVRIFPASFEDSTASHVEFSFRDTYLARSDMWRLVGQELAGTTVYVGQKITYLGSIKLTVKSIHVRNHKVPTAFFAGTTIPVFRSEAARYVLFIQMSSEMWDFDSEGNGEIMFNRVINGFLPELFKRWTDLDVRHLVSIVLFGRLEYDRFELARNKDRRLETAPISGSPNMTARQYQDFYRVVVTDMASAQWTTILDELKKDFRVFLRDISLHTSNTKEIIPEDAKAPPTRIAGRPSAALKGNILEAINIASSQFAHDFEDRDLIRTGVSIVVVTAGTGVFEVHRDLLNLTSQNLTNNGVGIDIVCLSRMPLHSVPLFKYRTSGMEESSLSSVVEEVTVPEHRYGSGPSFFDSSQPRKLSPALSSAATNSTQYFASFISGRSESAQGWSYGIPQWVDLSYWSAEGESAEIKFLEDAAKDVDGTSKRKKGPFLPRVRMYEIQMMGLMELGMADMTIPFMAETQLSLTRSHKRAGSKRRRATGSRSLSHSPTLSRKSRLGPEPTRISQGLLSLNAKALGDIFDRMDAYDSQLFQIHSTTETKSKAAKMTSSLVRTDTASSTKPKKPQPEEAPKSGSGLTKVLTNRSLNSPFRPQLPSLVSADASSPPLTTKKAREISKVNRTLNYALRGLAPPVRAIASTEVNITNVEAHSPFGNLGHSRPSVATSAASIRSVSTNSVLGEKPKETPASVERSNSQMSARPDDTPSKPISINTPLRKIQDDLLSESQRSSSTTRRVPNHMAASKDDLGYSKEADSESSRSSGSEGADDSDSVEPAESPLGTSIASSVPRSTLPYVRNVNASNPLKRHPERESFFGRWQHLYPRKPRAATVKWKSLCTPASVPLTTEDFPTKDELEMDYDTENYHVILANPNEMLEEPESRDILLGEMLALRFSHGYQLVVGPSLLESVGPGTCDTSSFFTPNLVRPDGSFIVMSMGNTIQKLSLEVKNRIQVTRYIRRPPSVQPPYPQEISYYPNIRTILSEAYKIRDMRFNGFSEQYPWEAADRYLADFRKQNDVDVKALRFWRARFVLIPVAPPVNSWRPTLSEAEESEEEIHLRGIRALTQMWQKARYVPPDERRPAHIRSTTTKGKDRNPLRINLETLNPSELVATELDKLIAAEEAGEVQTTQLLPEAEQFERDSFSLPKLAQALQGENGIEIKTRRWHLRLYYSCFMGEDLTNWLVHNFRDIDTREEAVELGNDLMKENLFEHVNSKHNFKDGNYFYSIKPEFRIQRMEARQSWFPASRRSDRSIPPTPATEHPTRELISGRSRSGSNLANHGQVASELAKTLGDKKRRTVTLSKMIRIDVDTRKRSNRPEIINLHYDRLHNPENCYHLELAWFNVTSKLVDDAIVSWSTQAEKYGLKLVEVPIAEAFKVPEHEPFRAAYRIKLALQPPRRSVVSTLYFTAVSFGPQAPLTPDINFYQKAILKRFNFVLDLEAPSEFPENVEIKYSWGDLDYRYTQFVHRSGVVLAQITDEGDILLLANRLYNSRQASAKDSSSRFDAGKKDLTPNASSTMLLRPQTLSSTHSAPSIAASGIIGLNVQSPHAGPYASPLIRPLSSTPAAPSHMGVETTAPNANTSISTAVPPPPMTPKVTADVLGTRRALIASGFSHFVTPEQIKDDLEAFCADRERLDTFYKEVTATLPAQHAAMRERERDREHERYGGNGPLGAKDRGYRTAGTGSSLLRPIREPESETGIPEFRLPDPLNMGFRKKDVSVVVSGSAPGSGSGTGTGTGTGAGGTTNPRDSTSSLLSP